MTRGVGRGFALALLVGVMAGSCSTAGSGVNDGVTSSSTAVSTVPPTTSSKAVTTTSVASTTSTTDTTLDTSGGVLHETPDYGLALFGPHVASTFAPASGWVVTKSPGELRIWFPGVESPDTLAIADTIFEGTGGKDWGAGVEVSYEPGMNHVLIVVTRGSQTTSFSVPITYLPNGTVQLAKVAAADATSVTLDYGYWDSDGEFESPSDDDVGVLHTVPITPDTYVILHETAVADYAWFLDQYQRKTPHDDIGWYPDPEITAYWATIDNGNLVELWYIPVG